MEKSDTVPPFLSSTEPPLGVCGVERGGSVNYPHLLPSLHSWLGTNPSHPSPTFPQSPDVFLCIPLLFLTSQY